MSGPSIRTRLARWLAILLFSATVLGGIRPAEAKSPDPTIAALISAAATFIPIGVTTGLWLGGRGTAEGIRFDLGMTFLAVGTIAGPSVGQIYAQAESDAWVTFILRALTGSVMLAGVGFWARGDGDGALATGQALTFIGGVPAALLGIYDIIDSASSAVETQRRRGHGPSVSLTEPVEIAGLSLCSAAPHACRSLASRAQAQAQASLRLAAAP